MFHTPLVRIFCLIILSLTLVPNAFTPITGLTMIDQESNYISTNLPTINSFISTVKSGRPGQLSGVFVPKVMALPVIQQPEGDAGYVSPQPAVLTQFRMAQQYHSVGLLAHDFLAGAIFTRMQTGDDVILIYGDGSLKYYQVVAVKRFQALSPSSPYSKFIDLDSRAQLTAEQLFFQTYGKGGSTLVFQTCISKDNISSWGRLFILAQSQEENQPGLVQTIPLIEQALTGARQSLSPMKQSLASY